MALNGRHLALISTYSMRYSIRGGVGLVFCLVTLTFGLLVAHMLLQPTEMVVRKARASGGEVDKKEIVDMLKNNRTVRHSVAWVLGGSRIDDFPDYAERRKARKALDAWTDHLLDDHPALLSAILLILLWGWPFVISMGAFNLYSGDVQSRGLRYHLMRADRTSIFFGRIVGMFMSQLVVLSIMMLTIAIYMAVKLPFYGWGPLLSWSLYGGLMLLLLSLPYIALCSWVSAGVDSPFASLTIVSLVIGGVPLVALIGRESWAPLQYVNYTLPWGIQQYLFHPDVGAVLAAVLACLAYSAIFFFLGLRHFLRRDL